MHIYILGICGTFMGSLALLARELGHRVSGCDQHTYPPMSTQLLAAGIDVRDGYHASYLDPKPDCIVIGNALARGNPMVEYVLDKGLPYVSGPEWLARNVLRDRWVLAVAGTHGKTTTSTMLTEILEHTGLQPGFLIGGVTRRFGVSARLGSSAFFVVEADEYDSAFFDKRSKFIHYHPRTLILNNLEFDHADIFPDLGAIQRQMHHLVRTVPGQGLIITPAEDEAIRDTLRMGCWSEHQTFSVNGEADLGARLIEPDGSVFDLLQHGETVARVKWNSIGRHNVSNALAAILAARHIGVQIPHAAQALSTFSGVARRLEMIAKNDQCQLYDDFAHHPTAIRETLAGLRARVGQEPILALVEPRSNTMKMGVHRETLLASAQEADQVVWANFGDYDWLRESIAAAEGSRHEEAADVDAVEASVRRAMAAHPQKLHVVMMSNGGFGGLPARLRNLVADSAGPAAQ